MNLSTPQHPPAKCSPHGNNVPSPDRRVGWGRRSLSLVLLVVAGVCFWNGLPDRLAEDAGNAVVADAQAAVRVPQAEPEPSGLNLKTTPIQDIRVGQRVLANNPEASDEERESWVEPDWSQWQQVSLEMPKPDGSLLKIEMLRPTEWLETQGALVVESREIIAHPGPLGMAEGSELRAEGEDTALAVLSEPGPNRLHESGSALRAESPDRADATESRATEPLAPHPSSLDSFQPALVPQPLPLDFQPIGLVVEMDLPELGLTDLAWVTDISDCPEIEPVDSQHSPSGRVVTATFHHSSGDVIDLVVEDTAAVGWAPPTSLNSQGLVGNAHPTSTHPSKETIGTTSNHPFWSVDRQEYVQAGQLDTGERVLTFSGDTKRVVTKLPRPGPQPVYNLEVHAEHVYFVGEDGLLVHNAYGQPKASSLSDLDFAKRVAAKTERFGIRKGWGAAGTGPRQGSLKHTHAERLVKRYQRLTGQRSHLQIEESFLGGIGGRTRGMPGSARPDIYNSLTGEVYDYKFTRSPTSPISARQQRHNAANLPSVTSQHAIHP